MPFPAPPTGVDLDLLLLGARQRARALVRGAGLVCLGCFLLPTACVLVVGSAATLAVGVHAASTVATFVVGAIAGACGWLSVRRGWRLIGRAFRVGPRLEAARLDYERLVLQLGRRPRSE